MGEVENETVNALKKLFKELDCNGDGKLDKNDIITNFVLEQQNPP
eukprot:CAMPEP_0194188510 /NCGR_PEP_ID=MMETSP0154-20130528/55334_1 /TAXON_ID=1049557 /ORGANISM="Thalassiothrix antarctica, Strain L6-D1" /LENGTH=44 /DNA_ID= /DNA_START= /DNA_END= /DNA_ORIENTATION=